MQTDFLPRPLFSRVSRISNHELSPEAYRRLDAVKRYQRARQNGVGVDLACQTVGIPRATLLRWVKAHRDAGPRALEPRSRRPRRCRRPQWTIPQLRMLRKLRKQFPVWGKKKLVRLMAKSGHVVSESTVGRMLGHLIEKGDVSHAVMVSRVRRKHRRKALRTWAKRLKRGQRLKAGTPGAAVQLDHMTVSPQPGVDQKHFNAHCCVSKWNVAYVCHRATAKSAATFLDKLIRDSPFPITRLQIDGGSEFMGDFEDACAKKNIPLYVLAPKSPEMNGGVERCNKTWRDEFYNINADLPTQLEELRPEVNEQQMVMNRIRPHEHLDQMTPVEYLQKNWPEWAPESHM